MSAHDRWLANYHRDVVRVWCANPRCPTHTDGVDVTYESEYGQGAYTPEECSCGGDWLEDQPEEVDVDEIFAEMSARKAVEMAREDSRRLEQLLRLEGKLSPAWQARLDECRRILA